MIFLISSISSGASWHKYYSLELISTKEFEKFIKDTLMDDERYIYKVNHHADVLFFEKSCIKIKEQLAISFSNNDNSSLICVEYDNQLISKYLKILSPLLISILLASSLYLDFGIVFYRILSISICSIALLSYYISFGLYYRNIRAFEKSLSRSYKIRRIKKREYLTSLTHH